ncbi:MAG TPA: cytochrome c peroxidase [Xanthobacteraceae bacterium]
MRAVPYGIVCGAAAILALAVAGANCAPITSRESVLPPGTELNEEPLDQPTELFASELAGKRSYQSIFGDVLFSSPNILGGVARQAGLSCQTCHQQGHNNPKLFVPGLSSRPGTFDTTGALFEPKSDNGIFDPVTPPSLRGAKRLAPYGHDGRFATLRDFVRNVIVNEFAGAEPSGEILDALVAYIEDISFLPNPKLGPDGRLTGAASAAAHRGEAVFNRPFPHDAAMSCASCHQPSADFADHKVHDVGSGGTFKTSTLLNADFNAPYFHDGRYDTYEQVIEHFDRHFDLGLTAEDKRDLLAYLDAVGDAAEPISRKSVQAEVTEIGYLASVLDTAIPAHDKTTVALAVDVVGNEWRELGEHFPGRGDTSVAGGLSERLHARGAVRGVVLALREVAMAAAAGDFDAASQAYADYKALVIAAAPTLKAAEAWSLFNPEIREAHFAALQSLARLAR